MTDRDRDRKKKQALFSVCLALIFHCVHPSVCLVLILHSVYPAAAVSSVPCYHGRLACLQVEVKEVCDISSLY